jgi:hypothetical protein
MATGGDGICAGARRQRSLNLEAVTTRMRSLAMARGSHAASQNMARALPLPRIEWHFEAHPPGLAVWRGSKLLSSDCVNRLVRYRNRFSIG